MRRGHAFLWLSAIPAALLRYSPGAAQLWTETALPRLRSVLSSCSALVPFPVCDLLFLLLLLFGGCWIIQKRASALSVLAGALVFSLSLTWLAPCALSEQAPPASASQLRLLACRLSQEAAAIQKEARTFDRNTITAEAALLCGSEIMPKAAAWPTIPKLLGIAGWWSPLTGEAVVDMTMGELNLPFALCHELMHAQGIAGEAQAHLGAYRACMQGSAVFRYSGTMNALWYAMDALKEADRGGWEQIVADMDSGVRADFVRMNGICAQNPSFLIRLQDACTSAPERKR